MKLWGAKTYPGAIYEQSKLLLEQAALAGSGNQGDEQAALSALILEVDIRQHMDEAAVLGDAVSLPAEHALAE